MTADGSPFDEHGGWMTTVPDDQDEPADDQMGECYRSRRTTEW